MLKKLAPTMTITKLKRGVVSIDLPLTAEIRELVRSWPGTRYDSGTREYVICKGMLGTLMRKVKSLGWKVKVKR